MPSVPGFDILQNEFHFRKKATTKLSNVNPAPTHKVSSDANLAASPDAVCGTTPRIVGSDETFHKSTLKFVDTLRQMFHLTPQFVTNKDKSRLPRLILIR
jgi:hypothetical protein